MVIKDRTRRALGIAVLTWGGSMAALVVAGLATSVWRLSDLWGLAGVAFLSEFGVIAIVGTFLLVGGPVFLLARYELLAPIIGLVCYIAYWAILGMTTGVGVSALYVGIMYGLFALAGIAVLTVLEWILRAARQRRLVPVD
ncbi:hypothetical protein [Halocatena salina]|uniref:Uncharacterized protein n=1 Tax=Halocatena salina TaxID=2934340 RepID=A0A8U0AB04_9EURY|nr:hypothetical protein [Halocatena salina]UPM44957.1 hypothetical protein MW046_18020 [Halocatena salina]